MSALEVFSTDSVEPRKRYQAWQDVVWSVRRAQVRFDVDTAFTGKIEYSNIGDLGLFKVTTCGQHKVERIISPDDAEHAEIVFQSQDIRLFNRVTDPYLSLLANGSSTTFAGRFRTQSPAMQNVSRS